MNKIMKLKELFTFGVKSSIKAGDAVNDGEYMFFTSSSDKNKRYSDYQFDSEGIIMGTGGKATLHYYNGKFSVSTDCLVLLTNEFVRSKYLYYYLLANMKVLEAGFKGAGLKHTNKKYIEEITINHLPSIEEQDCIIVVLDTLNNIISEKANVICKLDEVIKARFVEMFGDPESNSKGWPVASMSSICKVGSSKRIYQNEQTMDGVPFMRISNLMDYMDTGELKTDLYIPEDRYNELTEAGQVPVPGDILVTSRGTLGRCYIIKESDRFYFQDGMISWLSQFKDYVLPLYISYLFDISGFRKQIDNMQAGSTVAYLSIAMIKKLNVMVPELGLQEQFASFVRQVDKSKFVA